MTEEGEWPVKLHVYDLSKGMARGLSAAFLGKQIDGIWHTGIVVYGQEFYYGGTGGIEACPPCGTILGQPDTVEELGMTQIPYDMFLGYLTEQAQSSFRPSCYHLLEHNCNTFSSEVAQFLTGKDIPSHIIGLPAEVLSTPFGQMIKPWVDAMSVQPSGGHSIFPSQEVESSSSGASAGGAESASEDSSEPAGSKKGPAAWENVMAADWKEPDDEEDAVEDAVIFTESPPDRKDLKEHTYEELQMNDLGLLSDIYDYLAEGQNPSWSLGKEHVQTLHTIIGNGKIPEVSRAGVCTLLQALVLRDDFISLLEREPTQLILKIMQHFEQLSEPVQEAFVKLLTNCSSTRKGHTFLVSNPDAERNMLKWTTHICVTCLLKDKTAMHTTASALALNLSRFQLVEDTQVEIGSAVLECLQKELSEETVYNLMQCLLQMMNKNTELCDLASVVGLNCSQHQKLSARVRRLCEKAQELSAL
ncbi:uncharacterized protein LOC117331352 [Pecten maximus]|uniref:uncharacterized protein LOC117331352 n=1 Tax=Pecten maximus TaxID=6579 RepID=UPI001458932D|nr:uncharacterized protein LOC117331352 [Pecten maximus]